MLIAIIVLIGLSLLILGHEAGHFLVAKLFGMKIDEFGFGFPPRIFAWRRKQIQRSSALGPRESAVFGETEYSVNWLPFGGFVKIAGENERLEDEGMGKLAALPEEEKKRYFGFRPAWQKSLVILAGVTVNFLIGWLLVSAVFMVGTPDVLVISGTEAGSPAAQAGLAQGDIIRNYTDSQSFINFVNQHKGQQISLDINRGGKDMTFNVTPRANVAPNEGALGIYITQGGAPREGFFAALWDGLKSSVLIIGMTVQALYLLIQNLFLHGSLLQGVVGPVGIFGVAEQTGSIGLIYLVQLVSLISLNLAVVNLIPFPALDGGRFLLILIEKIKGSPISRKAEIWVNNVGFALLIIIMVLITVRDIGHLF